GPIPTRSFAPLGAGAVWATPALVQSARAGYRIGVKDARFWPIDAICVGVLGVSLCSRGFAGIGARGGQPLAPAVIRCTLPVELAPHKANGLVVSTPLRKAGWTVSAFETGYRTHGGHELTDALSRRGQVPSERCQQRDDRHLHAPAADVQRQDLDAQVCVENGYAVHQHTDEQYAKTSTGESGAAAGQHAKQPDDWCEQKQPAQQELSHQHGQ